MKRKRIEGEGRGGAWGERKEENCRGREGMEHEGKGKRRIAGKGKGWLLKGKEIEE